MCKKIIFTRLVSDLPLNPISGSSKGICAICKEDVWQTEVTTEMLKSDSEEWVIVCAACGVRKYAERLKEHGATLLPCNFTRPERN